jgi:riboflavin synthase
VGQRLGGHWVTGHVDGVGTVLDRRPDDESHRLIVSMPRDCRPFLAPRGSIAIQGVSLTVTAVSSSQFEVVLIPYTCQHTTLGHLVTGAFVNLEVDILARYTLANANVTQPLHPAFHEHA